MAEPPSPVTTTLSIPRLSIGTALRFAMATAARAWSGNAARSSRMPDLSYRSTVDWFMAECSSIGDAESAAAASGRGIVVQRQGGNFLPEKVSQVRFRLLRGRELQNFGRDLPKTIVPPRPHDFLDFGKDPRYDAHFIDPESDQEGHGQGVSRHFSANPHPFLFLVSRVDDKFYGREDPGVLTTIKFIINAGHKEKKWVGICGEMAGNPLAVPLLIGFGIDEMSVVPGILPEIKKIVRSLRYDRLREIAAEVLKFPTAEESESYLRIFLREKMPDLPLDNDPAP